MTAKIIKHKRYYGYRSAYHVKINGIIDKHKYINVPANKVINIILGRIK